MSPGDGVAIALVPEGLVGKVTTMGRGPEFYFIRRDPIDRRPGVG